MTAVAEGVETESVFEQLGELNCDAAQGYFISRPAPVGHVLEWIARREVQQA
jgi:EAL domain-containing protein (putative c-di-GMP-specific phosphodiesterase class I)